MWLKVLALLFVGAAEAGFAAGAALARTADLATGVLTCNVAASHSQQKARHRYVGNALNLNYGFYNPFFSFNEWGYSV